MNTSGHGWRAVMLVAFAAGCGGGGSGGATLDNGKNRILAAARTSVGTAFGAASVVTAIPGDALGGPFVSASCRSIYYAARDPDGYARIYVARR